MRTHALDLGILNGFRLTRGGEPVRVPLAAQRLLGFLALQQYPVHRLHVASMLRTDTSEERATASLRSTLWRLGELAEAVVSAEGCTLALADGLHVDLRDITARARSLISEPADYRDGDLALLADCGDVLPDWYDDWLQFERARMRQLRLHALEALSAALLRDRRFGQAAEAALAAVAADPLRESAHRALIMVHLAEGNTGEALCQYRTIRRVLRDQLGISPSPAAEELIEEVVADRRCR
jgi:DNA-binding SARP family transcriptional activator